MSLSEPDLRNTWTRSSPIMTRGHRRREAAKDSTNADEGSCTSDQGDRGHTRSEDAQQPGTSTNIEAMASLARDVAESGVSVKDAVAAKLSSMDAIQMKDLLEMLMVAQATRGVPAQHEQESSSKDGTGETTGKKRQAAKVKLPSSEGAKAKLPSSPATRLTTVSGESTMSGADSTEESSRQSSDGREGEDFDPQCTSDELRAISRPNSKSAPKKAKKKSKHGRQRGSGAQDGGRSTSCSKMAASKDTMPDPDQGPSGTGASHRRSRRDRDDNRDSQSKKATRKSCPDPEAEARQRRSASRNNKKEKATKYQALELALNAAREAIQMAIEARQPEATGGDDDDSQTRRQRRRSPGRDDRSTPKGPRRHSPSSSSSSRSGSRSRRRRVRSRSSGDSSSRSSRGGGSARPRGSSGGRSRSGSHGGSSRRRRPSVSSSSSSGSSRGSSAHPRSRGKAQAQVRRPKSTGPSREGAHQERSYLSESRLEMSSAQARSLQEPEHARSGTCQNQLGKLSAESSKTGIPRPFTLLTREKEFKMDKKLRKFHKNPINIPVTFKKLAYGGGNYTNWKKEFRIILINEDCEFLIDDPPELPWNVDTDILHKKAFGAFLRTVDPGVLASIPDGMTLHQVWKKLESLFQSDNTGTTTRLSIEFYNSKLRPGVDMGEHLINVKAKMDELVQRGCHINNETLITVLLGSVQGIGEWDYFIANIEGDQRKFDIDYLSGRMIEEFRRQEHTRRIRGQQTWNSKGHRGGHRFPAKKQHHFEQANAVSGCFQCGSKNHFKSNCPQLQGSANPSSFRGRWRGYKKGNGRGRGSFMRGGQNNVNMNLNSQNNNVNVPEVIERVQFGPYETNAIYNTDIKGHLNGYFWLADSGAGAHIAHDIKEFKEYQKINTAVRMANGDAAKVSGIGTVEVPGLGDLKDVLHVPSIPNNLMSVMRLCDDRRIDVLFRYNGGKIFKRGKVIGRMRRHGNLPYLIPKGEGSQGAVAQVVRDAQGSQEAKPTPKGQASATPKSQSTPVVPSQPAPRAESSTGAGITTRSYASVVRGAEAPESVASPKVVSEPKAQQVKKGGKCTEKKNNIEPVIETVKNDNVNDNIETVTHDKGDMKVIGTLDEESGDIEYIVPVEAVNSDEVIAAQCREVVAPVIEKKKKNKKKKGSKGKRASQPTPAIQPPVKESSTPVSEAHTHTEVRRGQPIEVGKPLHDKCAHILHRKLAHVSFKAIKEMPECTEGLDIRNCRVFLDCSVCAQAKSKVAPTPRTSTRRAERPYQLIHTDVVGPFPASLGGKRFFLTVVDDFSRFSHVFMMRDKTEVLEHLQYLHAQVENQHGLKISQIQSDRGSEYTSRQFVNWTKKMGIKHFTSPPFTPQANGISERKNGVLQTMKNSLLADANLGHEYWGEAIVFANYTLNRVWSSVVGQTPYGLLYGRKPSLAHLRIFGTKAWVHIPKAQRRKGDPISKELTFVGYAWGSKAYRFLDEKARVVISNSAVFSEGADWSRIHSNDLGVFTSGGSSTEPAQPASTSQQPQQESPDTSLPAPAKKPKKKGEGKASQPSAPAVKAPTQVPGPSSGVTAAPERPGLPASRAGDEGHGDWEVVRRSNRSTKGVPPKKLAEEDYIAVICSVTEAPRTYNDVLSLPDEEQRRWREAMESEMASLRKLQVFTPQPLPKGSKTIGTRWVYKLKQLANNKSLYKARLVAQGYSQKYLQDYCETYSPTVRAESVKAALVIAAARGEVVYQYDVQTAYLHANLDYNLYVRCAPGFEDSEGRTWLLRKSLYGLKQSGKQWYDCLADALKKMGYRTSLADHCVFLKHSQDGLEKVLVYVDDLLYIGPSQDSGSRFAQTLGAKFTLKSLGKVDRYLGVQISRTERGYALSQEEKIKELILKCKMVDAKPVNTPMQTDFWGLTHEPSPAFEDNTMYRSVVGSLLYISNWSRPDIALAVNLLARHVETPKLFHWQAAKRVLRYLGSTAGATLLLEPTTRDVPSLSACADADWAQDPKTRRSTSGFLIVLNGAPIHWHVGQQKFTSCSSAESEYACLSDAANDLQWFDALISDLWEPPNLPLQVMEDNTGAIGISKVISVGPRSRHIDIRYKNVRQLTKMGFITIIHRKTEEQVADIFTKPLPGDRHAYLCGELCLRL